MTLVQLAERALSVWRLWLYQPAAVNPAAAAASEASRLRELAWNMAA